METIQGHLATFQPHLLTHFNSLDDDDKDTFVGHLRTFDFGRLDGAFKRALEPPVTQAVEDIQPVRADRHVDREQLGSEEADRFLSIGLKAIASGHIGAIVLAGGQASRLGSDRPKGVLSLGTSLGSSTTDSLLFIQAAQIAHLQRIARERFPEEAEKSGEQITWLVMTSQTTDKETRAHLETVLLETGLQPSQVVIFTQNEIPAFDFEGHALLKSSTQLVTAPDGNGGMYGAIESLLPELEKRGVQYLHIYCVDNILCRVADPLMIGCAIDRKADCTLKVIEKVDPSELVGHVCLKQGKVHVLEYSEIPRELAEQRDHANPQKLFLRAGSIANHLVTLQFLRDACAEADTVLPYHVAKKRIPYWEPERKEVVRPEQPNGIKLERFIFDPFSLCKNVLVWQVAPAEEFSPLKNPDSAGRDCLSTCLRDLRGPKAQWIRDVCAECLTKVKTGN